MYLATYGVCVLVHLDAYISLVDRSTWSKFHTYMHMFILDVFIFLEFCVYILFKFLLAESLGVFK